jgi:hypothetical protein
MTIGPQELARKATRIEDDALLKCVDEEKAAKAQKHFPFLMKQAKPPASPYAWPPETEWRWPKWIAEQVEQDKQAKKSQSVSKEYTLKDIEAFIIARMGFE